MNERINELIKQSYKTVQFESGYSQTYFSQEKFAELIVKECAGICDKDYARSGQDGAGWRLAREIEEHFGVENVD